MKPFSKRENRFYRYVKLLHAPDCEKWHYIAETLNITCQRREYLEMIEERGLEQGMHVD